MIRRPDSLLDVLLKLCELARWKRYLNLITLVLCLTHQLMDHLMKTRLFMSTT